MATLRTSNSFLSVFANYFATVLMAFVWHSSGGQLVSIGPQDPNYCKKVERIRPNLILKENAHVHGVISDEVDNPIVRREVVLKSYRSPSDQPILRTVQTDGAGRFDLGDLAAGRYRLIASWTRAFRQPDRLQCYKASECILTIELKAPPTDGPASVCPVK